MCARVSATSEPRESMKSVPEEVKSKEFLLTPAGPNLDPEGNPNFLTMFGILRAVPIRAVTLQSVLAAQNP